MSDSKPQPILDLELRAIHSAESSDPAARATFRRHALPLVRPQARSARVEADQKPAEDVAADDDAIGSEPGTDRDRVDEQDLVGHRLTVSFFTGVPPGD